VSIVLTPLHGVGGAPVAEALARGGFTHVYLVPEQAEPDAAFPTVTFPNPEEPGALDLAIELARFRSADLVIANDPDADRCAVAVPDPHHTEPAPGHRPAWRALKGDELGWLLADYVLRTRAGSLPTDSTVACSIVSSRMLARIAAEHGVRQVETLTGFKWIARVPGLVFGYEEALGYCLDPEGVRDKDGLTAALVAAELAATLKAHGRTMLDALDDLARRHGVHHPAQVSIRVDDVAEISAMMRRLRSNPPQALGGSPVTAVDDLSVPQTATHLPPTDGVRLTSENGTRVVVRPSGTEPKLKCYLEAIVEVDAGSRAGLTSARAEALRRIETARDDMNRALGI
jgi:phosphomannomutase